MPLRAVLKEAFGNAKPWMGILFMLSLTAVTASRAWLSCTS